MNLTIITAVWKRPEVFEMFATGIKSLQRHFKGRLNIDVCISGSEGEESKQMVENHGYYYVEYHNRALGQKMNKAALLTRKTEDKDNPCDYYLLLGSDDIMGVDIMEHYFEEMEKGTDYVYVTDYYFFDINTKRALYWAGYTKRLNRGHACGAGRMISRNVMDQLNFQPWYDNKMHHGLDTAFDRRIRGIEMKIKAFNLKALGCFALDIKSSTGNASNNMTPFLQWDNTRYVDAKKMLFNNLPRKLATKIWGDKTNCPTCGRKL